MLCQIRKTNTRHINVSLAEDQSFYIAVLDTQSSYTIVSHVIIINWKKEGMDHKYSSILWFCAQDVIISIVMFLYC